MVLENRRKPSNAALRAKIDQLQSMGQQLKEAVDQVDAHTLAWVRQSRVVDLPSRELASTLQEVFQRQRTTVARIQKETVGAAAQDVSTTRLPLISDEEMTALMK